MKSVQYTNADGVSGFLNPEHVTHWYASGPDAIIVLFARGAPVTITNYSPGSFRQALEN